MSRREGVSPLRFVDEDEPEPDDWWEQRECDDDASYERRLDK